MNTKRKGNITEALILSEFIKRGIPTLIPFGDAEPYDLVIDYKDRFIKIQCKTCRIYRKNIEFNTVCTSHNTKNYIDNHYEGKIDFFATIYNGIVYLVPIEESTKTKCRLRINGPNKNGPKGKQAIEYELDKILEDL